MANPKQTQLHSSPFLLGKDGILRSTLYDDIYFSKEGGLDESEYVFLQGNHLQERFQQLKENDNFTIIETGFGTGLNFLAAWQCWDCYAPHKATLSFCSVEKYPLPLEHIKEALSAYSPLASYKEDFFATYATLLEDGYAEFANGMVKLHITFDDISKLEPALKKQNIIADAWFLDGFAPKNNPDMWQDILFKTMANHTTPDGTVATFTAAGFVKRALASAGFVVEKRKGFGKKREMLTGISQK